MTAAASDRRLPVRLRQSRARLGDARLGKARLGEARAVHSGFRGVLRFPVRMHRRGTPWRCMKACETFGAAFAR